MFARYIGEDCVGLIKGEIYWITVSEEVKHHILPNPGKIEPDQVTQRFLCISVGDYWADDYSSFGEAMMEWEFDPKWAK